MFWLGDDELMKSIKELSGRVFKLETEAGERFWKQMENPLSIAVYKLKETPMGVEHQTEYIKLADAVQLLADHLGVEFEFKPAVSSKFVLVKRNKSGKE